MSLELDARQRAMLEEIGVRVWSPLGAPAAVAGLAPADTAAPDRLAAPDDRAARPIAPPVPPTRPAPAAVTLQPLPTAIAGLDWAGLQQAVADCQACDLCQSRQNTVFGTGDPQARWLVVGEAPGEHEDQQGEPFVGASGQLLDNMLKAVGLHRAGRGDQGVYITNAIKCRPPANRNPHVPEVAQCEPFLRRQVELLQPRVILALGRFAAQALLQGSVPDVATIPLGKLRGQLHHYQGIPVVVSYHPAYLLRTPRDKARAWDDLCLAQEVMRAPR
jgi:DNA polymerase